MAQESRTPITPTVEERLPDIKASSFAMGRPYAGTVVPLLASVGCPYACNFCIDWNKRYRALSGDRLEADMRFMSENLPGTLITFHDPNFGVRFDEQMSIIERVARGKRNAYFIESSLKLLNPERLKRLQDTNCWAVAPGIESWTAYSNKSGVGKAVNEDKLEMVVEQMQMLHEYIPYIQANFVLGLDSDVGERPFELTAEFVRRTPYVWPYINIPMAFGGTPLYDSYLKEGRILTTMPFSFYIMPYLTLILRNYDPITYFEKMIGLHEVLTSRELFRKRMKANPNLSIKTVHVFRTYNARRRLNAFRGTLRQLQSDAHLLAFHRGETGVLPGVYADIYRRQLGKYAELVPLDQTVPMLSDSLPIPIMP